jgi:hypothetical protein
MQLPRVRQDCDAAPDVHLRRQPPDSRQGELTANVTGWPQDLPLAWLALIVFALTFLAAGVVFVIVTALAVGKRGDAFKAVSPGLLPPIGLLFALIVGFLAARVWNDAGRAQEAVNREASALRSVVLLVHAFPGDPEARMDRLVRRQIRTAVDEEWPAMAQRRATLTVVPVPLAEALRLGIGLAPRTEGQQHSVRSWTRFSPLSRSTTAHHRQRVERQPAEVDRRDSRRASDAGGHRVRPQ